MQEYIKIRQLRKHDNLVTFEFDAVPDFPDMLPYMTVNKYDDKISVTFDMHLFRHYSKLVAFKDEDINKIPDILWAIFQVSENMFFFPHDNIHEAYSVIGYTLSHDETDLFYLVSSSMTRTWYYTRNDISRIAEAARRRWNETEYKMLVKKLQVRNLFQQFCTKTDTGFEFTGPLEELNCIAHKIKNINLPEV